MTRAEKVRLANENAPVDERDPAARETARQEWGQIRRAAREAFLANGDWNAILNGYRDADGFYTADERLRMCRAYADELVMKGLR